MKHGFRFLVFCIIFLQIFSPLSVYANKSTVISFTLDRTGNRLIRTQDAFLPDRNIIGLGLSNPENIAFGRDDLLYIADSGNRRIVVFDTRTEEIVREVTHGEFRSPRGVFITPDEILYVADSGAGAVFKFDEYGEYLRKFTMPQTMAFADIPFSPYRIGVDMRGNMYIVGEGVANGIIQLSNEGDFLGFFASTQATRTFVQMLQDIFFTERQRQGLAARMPFTFSNVHVDVRGVVYTTAMGINVAMQGDALRRHDMAGRNTIEANIRGTQFIDVTVDAYGNIYVANADGFIFVYTNNGEFIFSFGAGLGTWDNIVGHFQSLISIAVSSEGHIWALDRELGFLQSFTPTEYALSIFRAINLFNQGFYDESGEIWAGVLRHNQMSMLAHQGMGRVFLYNSEYLSAQESFRLAGLQMYYSQAFWEVRNRWILDRATVMLVAIIVFFTTMSAIRHLDRKKVVKKAKKQAVEKIMQAKYAKNIMFAFSVMRHPLDSYYYLKIGEKGSVAGAAFHFILFFFAYMVFQTSRGFMVQMVEIADMDFNIIIGGFFIVFAIFVISNYLVSSINDGEGSIGDIFKLVSYGLFPFTITLFFVTIVSHVVTVNELFMIDFMMTFGAVWTVVLIWLGLQTVHDYSFGATLKSLLITSCFMVIFLVVMFNVIVLSEELYSFFDSMVREVYANVTGMY